MHPGPAHDRSPRSRGVPRRAIARWTAGLALVALVLAGCTDGDDPGLDPGTGEPGTTSNTLGWCPEGGPDATTPSAGCLGPDGSVLRP